MKKKMLIVLPSLGKGGAQRATINLFNYLSNKQSEIDFFLLSLKKEEVCFKVSPRINLIELNVKSFRKSIKIISNVIKEKEIDIVYTALWHINFLITLIRILNKGFFGRNFSHLASIHNNPSEIIKTEKPVFIIWLYYKFLYGFADRIICVSEGVFSHMKENSLAFKKKLVKLSNVIITEESEKMLKQDLNDAWVESKKKDYIVWIGRFDYQKNIDLLLQIIKRTEYNFLIIGDGPEESKLRHEEKEIGQRVKVLPFQENVYYFMKNARVLLLTSRFEGQGMVLVESMFSGTPVISSNCNYGPKELIQDKENGFLFENNNEAEAIEKINTMFRDESAYSFLVKKGKERSFEFKDTILSSSFEQIVEAL